MPTGTTKKLHDMLLATTTSGSIPAGRVKRAGQVHRDHRQTNRQRCGPGCRPAQLYDEQANERGDEVPAD